MYCGFCVGQPTQPSNIAKRVLRPSANSGCVKIVFYAFGSVRKLSGPIAEAYHLLIVLAFSRSFRPALI